MNSPRRTFLIVAAASLVAIKFLLLPWIGNQNSERQSLDVLTRRLERSVGVIENKAEILHAEAALTDAVSRNLDRFPQFNSTDAMKLDAQRKVGEFAANKDLKVSLFDWILVGDFANSGLKFSRARVQVSGELRKLALFQGDIEASFPNVVVRDLRIESVPTKEFVEVGGSFNLVMDFYFQEVSGK